MPSILQRPSWYLPDSAATDETAYLNRRAFLKAAGFTGMLLASETSLAQDTLIQHQQPNVKLPLPGYDVNPYFADAGRPHTHEYVGTTFNNFWEFSFDKGVAAVAKDFTIEPYTLTIDGLVDIPMTLSLEDIEKLGYEERVYRFRCVEAWSMTVPWMGVPLQRLVKLAQPKSSATFVKFTSFLDTQQAPNQSHPKYEWPYSEGLRIDEALNELGFVATGAYGKRLLPQSGTPLRIVTPWKYGYKGPKSVVRMTFTDTQPVSFWEEAVPDEYPFYSNVDPEIPHPRWSQATEKLIVDKANVADVEIIPTQRFNGYEKEVGHLYKNMPRVLM